MLGEAHDGGSDAVHGMHARSIPREPIQSEQGSKQRMNKMRTRGRNFRPGGGGGGGGGGPIRHQSNSGNTPLNRNHVFDSSGPDIRVRGTAQQLFEKYLQLGRDATSSGDRVMAEGYFQHAEHYFRILNAMNQAAAAQQVQAPQHAGPQHGGQQRRQYNGEEESPAPPVLEEAEMRIPGAGDQPEMRAIPIAAVPPEG